MVPTSLARRKKLWNYPLSSRRINRTIRSLISAPRKTYSTVVLYTRNAPHFGSLWEAAVKSFKYHFWRIVGGVQLTFEELTTVLTYIEACLNSRPLTPLPHPEDRNEAVTLGHFLVGALLEALPDTESPACSISLLRRWRLCQALVRHLLYVNIGPRISR